MKPIDFSRATFAEISTHLGALRLDVWRGLLTHGPCTTAQLADKIGMSILTVRPRVTELTQVGLARLVGGEREGREGVYEGLTATQAAIIQADAKTAVGAQHETQLDLRVHG